MQSAQLIPRYHKSASLRTAFQVEEYIGFDGEQIVDSQVGGRFFDEVIVYGIDFDRSDAVHAPRSEFVADRPRPGE